MIVMRWNQATQRAEIAVDDDNRIVTGGGIPTAVMLSYGTNARAREADGLPEGQRGGWWGDAYLDEEGESFGGRLWLAWRKQATDATAEDVRTWALEATAWMLRDEVASEIDVQVDRVGLGAFELTTTIYKPETPTPLVLGPWRLLLEGGD